MIEIELKQFAGKSRGIYRVLPMDQVIVVKADGQRVKVGFLEHKPNATLRFHRYLSNELREQIRRECEKIRKAEGRPEISLFTVGPANPEKIRAYLKGEIKPKRRNYIIGERADADKGRIA